MSFSEHVLLVDEENNTKPYDLDSLAKLYEEGGYSVNKFVVDNKTHSLKFDATVGILGKHGFGVLVSGPNETESNETAALDSMPENREVSFRKFIPNI